MTQILLISPDKTLFDSLRAALPAVVELIQVETVAKAGRFLAAQPTDRQPVDFIMLHAGSGPLVALGCSELRRDDTLADVPLIALLNQPEDRAIALESGATDYLLLPLLPAELSARLQAYLRSPLQSFQSLVTVLDYLKQGVTSPDVWERGLKRLSAIFQASAAWVFLLDATNERTVLAGGYNLPPLLARPEVELYREIEAFFSHLVQLEPQTSLDLIGPYAAWPAGPETNHLAQHVIVPLHSRRQLLGLLTLAYQEPPLFSKFERHTLKLIGQSLGILLEMRRIQEETQMYATQNAFMVLIARTISERLDLEAILSLTLEQIVPLLNASGGDLWLLAEDNDMLELTSSLASPWAHHPAQRRTKGQGLIGWVAEHGLSLYTATPLEDDRSDRRFDHWTEHENYSLLAVPLNHRQRVIGVLAVYNRHGLPFSHRDTLLLEGIASLTASAIANARLLQELRQHADQRRVLYEMSQQIAAGLDLQATLNRTLHWVGRLFSVEIGLLWLVDLSQQTLHLAATLGVDLPPDREVEVAFGQDIAGRVAQSGEVLFVNEPANCPELSQDTFRILQTTPRNLISAPMSYHGQAIGVLCLANKRHGPFDETDLTLFSTALEMIAVAVGNARLYTQTVTLMNERERLHRQILQAERLATLGRLTASLSHEINNPMQAIQGALTLALEDLQNPAELETYIRLSLGESERVVKLLSRLRQIYRPQTDTAESIDVNHLLHETIALARKELKRQKISLRTNLAAQLPRLTAVANQLHLVFLSLLLNLSEAMGDAQGRELYLCSYALPEVICVEFWVDYAAIPVADWLDAFQSTPQMNEAELSFGLSLSQDIVVAHGGDIKFEQKGDQIVCRVELPLVCAQEH